MDPNQQAIFDAGNLFEKYAEQLFPGVVRLGFESGDYSSLPTRTKSELDNGTKVLAQGRFEVENITCICDVLVKVDENTFDLFETKSSTKAKPEHEFDLAFQTIVLEESGYKVRNISVIHINNKYVRDGDIDPKQIAAVRDITSKVREREAEVKGGVKKALEVVSSPTIPDISPSLARDTDALNEWLPIYRSLTTVDPYSIYDLFYAGVDRLGKLEELAIKNLADIPEDFPLNDKQKLQVLTTRTGEEIIKKSEIKEFLSKLEFPLYFLDYETLSSAIPYFDGLSPYQQVPFQYSLHILDSPGSNLRHATYLHTENLNPAQAISKSLKENIGKKGTVIVWHESFEKGCNRVLGSLAPEYKSFFEDINERIVDLKLPFANSWYVHKDFGGSASIKDVLPVLVPELSYKDNDISEGKTAQRLWMEAVLDGKHDGEKDKILKDLEKYCKLDTMAMVEIYKKLQNLNA